MMQDLLRIILAFVLFSAVVIPTGYLFAFLANLLAMRRSPARAWVLSPALGLGLCPLFGYLAGKCFRQGDLVLLAALSVVGMVFMLRNARHLAHAIRRHRNLVWIVAGWMVLSILLLPGISIGKNLFVPISWIDYAKHNSITDAITRTGIPPESPFLHPGKAFPTFYYYGWFVLSSVVDRAGGSLVDPLDAVFGGIIFTGIAMMSATLSLAAVCLPAGLENLRKRGVTLLLLLCLNGLDVIPTAVWNTICLLKHRPDYAMTVERWNEQIAGWLTMMLWVPQHCGAAIAGIAAFTVIRWNADSIRRVSPLSSFISAACVASCAMMSVYVALAVIFSLCVWLVVILIKRGIVERNVLLVTGAMSILLILPFLLELNSARSSDVQAIKLAVRKFTPVHLVLNRFGYADTGVEQFGYLVTMPLNYFCELGIFLVAGWVFLRRFNPRTTSSSMLLTILTSTFLVASFLKSAIRFNDLGWRSMIPAQMVLLLFTAIVIEHWGPFFARATQRIPRLLLQSTLILGVAATVMDLLLMRAVAHIDKHIQSPITLIPADIAWYSRDVYGWVDRNLPRDAIIQFNPAGPIDPFAVIYQRRQVVCSNESFGLLLGTSEPVFRPLYDEVRTPFMSDVSEAAMDQLAGKYAIDVAVVWRDDKAFADHSSWAWKRPLLYENDQFRVIDLRKTREAH